MTQTDKARELFQARPNEWISAVKLAHYIGLCAWRTRVSDLRKKGMTIENRTVRDPFTGTVHSYYRYNREASHAQ